jgi:TRAP-type uncharacterized transport system substrate-binding protein
VPDDKVYAITKAFWTAWKNEAASAPWLRNISPERAFTDLNLPLHPGSARYYKEIGMTIPDAIMPAN